MFKLLAIRPLPGCAPYIQKCLRTGMMYYFCNDYIIEPNSHIRRRSKNIKPLKDDFFSVPMPNDNAENVEVVGSSPTVNVSAIVGMNGDGKSTLVELMMRLINNCAISYNLCISPENLRRVEHVKVELYYMLDKVVYRMAEEKEQQETKIWKIAELHTNSESEEMMRWEIKQKKIAAKNISNSFFFTIVSNYSHYAYNVYDYEKEWDLRGNEEDDDKKCWLHYIFHKNDGYLTPITLHPLRKKGNIDINNELNLSRQRLLSLFLNAENPSDTPNSFRRVNGKDANVLKLTEVSESKLQQKTILDFFENKQHDNRFKNLLEKIYKIKDKMIQATRLDNADNNSIYDYINDYINLIDSTIPFNFTIPINNIIEQDDGFCDFANQVVNWITTNANNKSTSDDGDIMTVVRKYEELDCQNKAYFQIAEIIQNAWHCESNGEYTNAWKYCIEAKKESENKLGREHAFTALIYNDLAVIYKRLAMFDKALDYYNKALKIKSSQLGAYHPSIATTYNNIGRVYYVQRKYTKALDYYNKVLDIQKQTLGTDHPDIATTYNNIGRVCYAHKNYPKALEYYSKALAIDETAFGTLHPDTATTYNNIGRVCYAQKKYTKALDYYNKALDIQDIVLGTDHPDTATTYNNIGRVYYAQREYTKALDYYYKALDIQKQTLGTDHPNTATTYNNIGRVYYAKKEYPTALDYYNIALNIQKQVLGTNHSDTATTYNNLYKASLAIGDSSKAREDLIRARTIAKTMNRFYDKTPQEKILLWKTNQKNSSYEENTEEFDTNKILEFGRMAERLQTNKRVLLNTEKHKYLNFINASQLGRLDALYRIMKSNGMDTSIVAKNYSDLSLEEKCQHYIIYKFWSILSTYPQYHKVFEKEEIESLREFGPALEKCIEDIKNDCQSHITRKIRQVENFMHVGFQKGGLYEQLGTKDKETGAILVDIDKLKDYYGGKSFSLDNLPPPIYKWDIIFNRKDDSTCAIELDSFSSGEKQMLNSIGAIVYHLHNLANTASEIKYDNVNLIMEEIELYYHPEYQRLFFSQLLDLIKRAKLGNIKNVNIVFVTHSPFILSDIPKCNVLFLKDGMPKDIMQENTFGANIHSLLKNGFFMPNLPIGEFAYEKINKLFGKLNSGNFNPETDLDDIYQEILLVGEPFLRNQLLMLYNSYKGSIIISSKQ